jgi:hypothetical protein
MVATDVASRGIGMYQIPQTPSPPPRNFQQSITLYFTLVSRGYLVYANLPDVLVCVSTWFSIHGVLVRCVACTLLYSYVRSCTVFLSRGTSVNGGISDVPQGSQIPRTLCRHIPRMALALLDRPIC